MSAAYTHTNRFSGRVQAYLAYRPGFTREIITFLREHGALPEDAVVADVGAGTGMLAEIFLEAGHRVIAVEPNREMLQACRELARQRSALEVVEGSAEATTLPDASVDLIAVGRAMHWFDWPRAHQEFLRILRPDGWVLIATNGHRDSGAAVSNRLAEIFRKWRTDSVEADTRRDFNKRLQEFLDTSTWQRTTLHHSMTVDFSTLLGYAESLSATRGRVSVGMKGWWRSCGQCLRSISGMGCWSRRLLASCFLGGCGGSTWRSVTGSWTWPISMGYGPLPSVLSQTRFAGSSYRAKWASTRTATSVRAILPLLNRPYQGKLRALPAG